MTFATENNKYSAISIQCFWFLQKLSLNCIMSLNRIISCSELKNGLCKLVTKSQVVTKFNVTKSRLHCTTYYICLLLTAVSITFKKINCKCMCCYHLQFLHVVILKHSLNSGFLWIILIVVGCMYYILLQEINYELVRKFDHDKGQ